ncbi:MFS transporter [Sporolactobacillus spathodeae]|uniref:MFS family permease n=1 Tax=Sporolactobacillus spathodeae TaxID=1465502 RepID=A0ABS2QAB5_9BACL|nr:MFS transporter [Sporolactobacillus spathodeae]MBM7658663.1 MFS family permease [Sporolactobacillus spathodeae]
MRSLKDFPFSNKNYVYLLSSQIISNLGDWVYILALYSLVAIKWNAQPIAMTGLMLCMVLPAIFLGTLAGYFTDVFDRKKVMIISDIVRAIIILLVLVSHTLWEIFVIIVLESIASSFFEPAKEGKLKEIVEEKYIQKAVSYSEAINNGAKIAGPVISGLLVSTLGIYWSFWINALSFIISALLILALPRTDRVKPSRRFRDNRDRTKYKMVRELLSGFSLIKRSPIILNGLIIFSAFLLALQLSDSQTIVLLRKLSGQSINVLGLCMAASGAGMLLATILLSGKKMGRRLYTLLISPIILGSGLISAALFIRLPIYLIYLVYPLIFFICGFSFSMAALPFNVVAQQNTDSENTGKVFGTINSVTNLATIIGVTMGGIISELFGVLTTFIASGIFLVMVSLVSLSFKKIIRGNVDQIAKSSERIP